MRLSKAERREIIFCAANHLEDGYSIKDALETALKLWCPRAVGEGKLINLTQAVWDRLCLAIEKQAEISRQLRQL